MQLALLLCSAQCVAINNLIDLHTLASLPYNSLACLYCTVCTVYPRPLLLTLYADIAFILSHVSAESHVKVCKQRYSDKDIHEKRHHFNLYVEC